MHFINHSNIVLYSKFYIVNTGYNLSMSEEQNPNRADHEYMHQPVQVQSVRSHTNTQCKGAGPLPNKLGNYWNNNIYIG